MNQNEMIDVFISYRREGGSTAARLLYEILKTKKITGFMDVKTLTRGDYEASIFAHIKKARNFVLIVSVDVMKSPWVQKEIMYALELGKHVIPVFVNGVTCFPNDIPAEINAVDVNGICLNHENFDGDIGKLISWLDTRHNAFTQQYVEMWKEDYTSEKLLAAIKKVAGGNHIKDFLLDKFKNALQYNCGVDVLRSILLEYDNSDVKFILQNLNVEHKGSRDAMLLRLHYWLNNEDACTILEDENQEHERMVRLARFVRENFFSLKKHLTFLRNVCTELNIEFDSDDMTASRYMGEIIDSSEINSARKFLSVMGADEWMVKKIASELLGANIGRKNNLIDAIDRWVNYQDE